MGDVGESDKNSVTSATRTIIIVGPIWLSCAITLANKLPMQPLRNEISARCYFINHPFGDMLYVLRTIPDINKQFFNSILQYVPQLHGCVALHSL